MRACVCLQSHLVGCWWQTLVSLPEISQLIESINCVVERPIYFKAPSANYLPPPVELLPGLPLRLQTSTAALQMSLQPIISGLAVLRNDWSTAFSSGDVRRIPARTRQCRIAVQVISPLSYL